MAGCVSVEALAAGNNVEELVRQTAEFRPTVVSLAGQASRDLFWKTLAQTPGLDGYRPEVLYGPQGNLAVVTSSEVDIVVSAAVGVAGLEATYKAVTLGRRVALANKEVLVAAGDLVMEAARASGAEVLPVDSEHNGVHQCLRAGPRTEVSRLILTASGGPFRKVAREDLEKVTPEQALQHPTWKMGGRITVDSATLMNKGFEVIEARWLFDFTPEQIDVVVHPQSIVHALVEFQDGSVIAQLSPPDMKLPIRYALTYPEREAGPPERRLSWNSVRQLDFEPPDYEKFPLLRTAYRTLESGGVAGCVLNAADEVAVEAFLDGRLSFPGIARVTCESLERIAPRRATSIEEVLEADRDARETARSLISENAVN